MRTLFVISAFASMAIADPAMAQSALNGDYSANNRATMYGRSPMSNHAMMRHSDAQHQHAFGSMRHPTVGKIANQRVNGG